LWAESPKKEKWKMVCDVLSDANWQIAGYLKRGWSGYYKTKIAVVSAMMDELRAAMDSDGRKTTPLIDEFMRNRDVQPMVAALEARVEEAR
jgi:hypothetical protein